MSSGPSAPLARVAQSTHSSGLAVGLIAACLGPAQPRDASSGQVRSLFGTPSLFCLVPLSRYASRNHLPLVCAALSRPVFRMLRLPVQFNAFAFQHAGLPPSLCSFLHIS